MLMEGPCLEASVHTASRCQVGWTAGLGASSFRQCHSLLHTGAARPLGTFLQALSPALLHFPGALPSQTSVLWLCYPFSQIHVLPTLSFLTWNSCTPDELLFILHDLVQMSLLQEPFPVAQLCATPIPHSYWSHRDISVFPTG